MSKRSCLYAYLRFDARSFTGVFSYAPFIGENSSDGEDVCVL